MDIQKFSFSPSARYICRGPETKLYNSELIEPGSDAQASRLQQRIETQNTKTKYLTSNFAGYPRRVGHAHPSIDYLSDTCGGVRRWRDSQTQMRTSVTERDMQ